MAALNDPYASTAEYKAAFSITDAGQDTPIANALAAATRYIDQKLRTFFGIDQAVVARLFDGNGGTRLDLREAATAQAVPGFATLTGLVVKVDLDEDYDFSEASETLTIDTHFWAEPYNAALGPEPEPWTTLEIIPTNTVFSAWPNQRRAVEVTATWGWPTVPVAVREATIQLAALVRMQGPRATSRIPEGFDAAVEASPEARGIVAELVARYAPPVVFG